MTEQAPGGEWFSYADSAKNLMVAVSVIYNEVEEDGAKPGAEKWTTNEGYFEMVYPKIVSMWTKITGLDPLRFPFTKDYVRWAWITYRKDPDGGELTAWAHRNRPPLFE